MSTRVLYARNITTVPAGQGVVVDGLLIQNGSVGPVGVKADTLQTTPVSATPPLINQSLVYNGVSWAASTVSLTNGVSGILPPSNGGTGLNTSTAANGQLLIGNGAGFTIANISTGTGIAVTNSSGGISITNSGVLSLTGTANRVTVSAGTGAITLSGPQDIATTSSPTFANTTLTGKSLFTNGIAVGNSVTSASATGVALGKGSFVGSTGGIAIGDSVISGNAALTEQASTVAIDAGGRGAAQVYPIYQTFPVGSTFVLGSIRQFVTSSNIILTGTYTIYSGRLSGPNLGGLTLLGTVSIVDLSGPGFIDVFFNQLNITITPGYYTIGFTGSAANFAVPWIITRGTDNTNYPRLYGGVYNNAPPNNYTILVAITSIAYTGGTNTIAIGQGAFATSNNAVAIGAGINANVAGGLFVIHNTSVLTGSAINIVGFRAGTNELVELPSTLSAANGGTGLNTSTAANGQLLIGNGTGLTLSTLTTGTGISIMNSPGGISIANTGVITISGGTTGLTTLPGSGAVTLAGTLGPASGGTGLNTSTTTNGQLLIGNGTGFTLANITAGSGVTVTNAPGQITIAATGGSNVHTTVESGTTAPLNTVYTPGSADMSGGFGIGATLTNNGTQEYFTTDPVSTTVDVGSDTAILPDTSPSPPLDTLYVTSTTGFENNGFLIVNGNMLIQYTGKTATTFTNCTTASIGTLSTGQTVVSTFALGTRILVKDQTNPTENGVYTVTDLGSPSTNWVLTRSTDFNNSVAEQVTAGDFVFICCGPTLASTGYVQTSVGTGVNDAIIIGTDPILFTPFSSTGTYIGGTGINISGNLITNTGVINVVLDNTATPTYPLTPQTEGIWYGSGSKSTASTGGMIVLGNGTFNMDFQTNNAIMIGNGAAVFAADGNPNTNYAVIIGTGASSNGALAVVIGTNAASANGAAVIIGSGARASLSSVAIGLNTLGGEYTTSIGSGANASGAIRGTTIGINSAVYGDGAFSGGELAYAVDNGVSIGYATGSAIPQAVQIGTRAAAINASYGLAFNVPAPTYQPGSLGLSIGSGDFNGASIAPYIIPLYTRLYDTTATSNGYTALTSTSATAQWFTGTQTHSIYLPSTSSISNANNILGGGFEITIHNNSTQPITVGSVALTTVTNGDSLPLIVSPIGVLFVQSVASPIFPTAGTLSVATTANGFQRVTYSAKVATPTSLDVAQFTVPLSTLTLTSTAGLQPNGVVLVQFVFFGIQPVYYTSISGNDLLGCTGGQPGDITASSGTVTQDVFTGCQFGTGSFGYGATVGIWINSIAPGSNIKYTMIDNTGTTGIAGWDLPSINTQLISDVPVSATAPLTNQSLVYDGVNWEPNTVSLTSGVSGILPPINGGTGLDTSTATAGQLLIGNGTGLSLANLTAGTGVMITNGPGASIVIDAVGTAGVSTFSGGTTGLTPGPAPTPGVITLGGILVPANGGTGLDTSTAANGQLLIGNGTGLTLSTLTTGTGISIMNSPGSISIINSGVTSISGGTTGLTTSPGTGAITLAGTLGISNGGTGITTTPANGRLLIGNGTGYSLANLIQGSGVTITNGPGTITISATGGGAVSSVSGTTNQIDVSPMVGAVTVSLPAQIDMGVGYVSIGSLGLASTGGVCIGQSAGGAATSLTNVAIGNNAGASMTFSAFSNVLIGHSCAQNYNGAQTVAIGHLAGLNMTGGPNTLLGYQAGANFTSGNNNTLVGTQAGNAMTTSSSGNTFVGHQAGTTLSLGSNNTCLGINAQPSTANSSNEFVLGFSNVTALRCNQSSILGLSDRRDKSDIVALDAGLNFVDSLKPVRFNWNMRDGGIVGRPDTGFIAQDLQQAQVDTGINIPGLVYDLNPEKLEAAYGKLLPVLVKAIQELSARVKELEARNNNI